MCRVPADARISLKNYDPSWAGEKAVPKRVRKKPAKDILIKETPAHADAQDLLYAGDSWSILMIFQAMDAVGKDSTIKHVMSGVNPQGVRVTSFKQPSDEERQHDLLWRCAKVLRERGRIGILNRSYYEDVLVMKVHPDRLDGHRIPDGRGGKEEFWQGRYDDINPFERLLTLNGTKVLKFHLHVSKKEQRSRFLERVNDLSKHLKFSATDLVERGFWDDYTLLTKTP